MTEPLDACAGLAGQPGPAPVADMPPDCPALRTFYLYLSAGCNLHCRHCWITPTFVHGQPVPAECLDFHLLKSAVAEAQPLGLAAAKLTGGEPTLHPEFRSIVDFLTAAGLELSMETNATLIDRELAVHLVARTNLKRIAVSLDSSVPEAHDRFRGVKGAFAAAVAGIGHLVAAGLRPQIIMSVYRGNLEQIEGLIELAIRLGALAVKFNPVTQSGRGADLHRQGQGLDFDEWLALIHRIKGPLQDRYPQMHLGAMVPPAMSTAKELLRYGGEGAGCHVRHILGILGTGEMALCGIGRNIPELCFGKLGRDSLRDVWLNHPVLVQMRKDLEGPYPGICGDCLHAGRCMTHCLAQNFEANGKLVSPSPLCAEAERRGVFPATRRISWGTARTGA
ncbi:MAG: radical SAM protein [Kiritimatiellia bacterium]